MEITISIKEYKRLKKIEYGVFYFIRISILLLLLTLIWAILTIISGKSEIEKILPPHKLKGRMYHRGGSYGRS